MPKPPHLPPPVTDASLSIVFGPVCREHACAPSVVRLWVCEVAVVQTGGDPLAGNPLNSPSS